MKSYIQDSPEVNLVLKRHLYDVESQLNELVHKVLARIVEEDKYRMINAALLDSLDRKVMAAKPPGSMANKSETGPARTGPPSGPSSQAPLLKARPLQPLGDYRVAMSRSHGPGPDHRTTAPPSPRPCRWRRVSTSYRAGSTR